MTTKTSKQLHKGWWSTQEDEKLCGLVSEQGARNWEGIATQLGSRSAMQCRQRWMNYIRPGVRRDDWTPEEDSLIIDLVREFGPKWSKIKLSFPGRTDNAIKNHYVTLVRYGVAPAPPTWHTTTQVIAKQHASSTRTYPLVANQLETTGFGGGSLVDQDTDLNTPECSSFGVNDPESNNHSECCSPIVAEIPVDPQMLNLCQPPIFKSNQRPLMCPTALQVRSQQPEKANHHHQQKYKQQLEHRQFDHHHDQHQPSNLPRIPNLRELFPEIYIRDASSVPAQRSSSFRVPYHHLLPTASNNNNTILTHTKLEIKQQYVQVDNTGSHCSDKVLQHHNDWDHFVPDIAHHTQASHSHTSPISFANSARQNKTHKIFLPSVQLLGKL
eukprot:c6505_g1_i1.p1 GENE.c6505_g1_i1~~c6505_g1_i1.p1  ORF type:complete len:384 (-),score=70.31 c6505_g1_i1:177-1328(-)